MRALIDADILPYEFGGMVQLEDPEKPLEWEIVRSMVDDRINQIVESTGSDSLSLYLTDSATNFRVHLATIKPYKGHRKTEKPYHWAAIRQHLIDNWNAEVQYGIEADDRLGIEQCKAYKGQLSSYFGKTKYLFEDLKDFDHPNVPIICSRDKDLHMIPGWHYVWPAGKQEEKLWFQDEVSAIRCFYNQLLTGDTSDNILGLYGVGSSSKLVKSIEEMDEEQLMFDLVYKAYTDRFGNYGWHFLLENAALLWIKREEVDNWNGHEEEIHDRLSHLLSDTRITNEQQ